jgi:hypothetical protein
MSANQSQAPKEKVKLTISQVLNDLDSGLDRKAIKAKYGLTTTDVARLFQHDKLKGRRVKPAPNFELEDDAPDVAPVKVAKKATVTDAPASQATGQTATAQPEAQGAAIKEVATAADTVETGGKSGW